MANLAMLDKTTPFALSSESNSLSFQQDWPLATVGNMGGYFWKRKEIKALTTGNCRRAAVLRKKQLYSKFLSYGFSFFMSSVYGFKIGQLDMKMYSLSDMHGGNTDIKRYVSIHKHSRSVYKCIVRIYSSL